MSSTPFMASSRGVATVAAMTFGLAPGYWARTTTDGGTTSGYSEIGSARRASRPETKMSIDRTPAKIGRSMKNLERFMSRSRGEGGDRSEEHTSELQSLMRISYAVFCLKKKKVKDN